MGEARAQGGGLVDEPVRRRRRVRHLPEGEATAKAADAADDAWPGEAADSDSTQAERGLRGLVGSGSSQVPPSAALRARDAARPSAADLDRANVELTLVRRHWVPRD
jgi:hypothetical protein